LRRLATALAVLPLAGLAPSARAEPISFSYIGPKNSRGFVVWTSGSSRAPLVQSFSVFRSAARPADHVPPDLERQLVAFARVMRGSGLVELRDGRLLATGIGPEGGRLYAAPTTRGGVCYLVVLPSAAPNCLRALDHGLYLVIADSDGPGGRAAYVFGLADDSVTSLRLEVGRSLHAARLARNAFTYTLPRAALPAQAVRAVVVNRRNGTTQQYTLSWPR
jgi:hypothetical protein